MVLAVAVNSLRAASLAVVAHGAPEVGELVRRSQRPSRKVSPMASEYGWVLRGSGVPWNADRPAAMWQVVQRSTRRLPKLRDDHLLDAGACAPNAARSTCRSSPALRAWSK